MRLYSISDEYIRFLRQHPKLINVYDNKEGVRVYTRKYLGTVLTVNELQYFIPLSTPKKTDYIEGKDSIRPDTLTIIRIKNRRGTLRGTLRISSMIPVPECVLEDYSPDTESDRK